MPIRAFLDGKSFNPEEIELMNAAFEAVCAELGVKDKSDPTCTLVAKRVILMARGYPSSQAIRSAVIASLKLKP